jgi:Tfp pilus assembly protein PilF
VTGARQGRGGRRRALLLALALFVPAAAAPAAVFLWQEWLSPAARVTRLRAQAAAELHARRPAAAVERLLEARALAPADARVLVELGQAQQAAGDRRGAIAAYQAACRADEDDVEARLRLGWAALDAGEAALAREALAWLSDPVREGRVSSYAAGVALLGFQVDWRGGDAASAARRADGLLRGAPRMQQALVARSRAAVALGELDVARRLLSRAVEGAPDDPALRELLSRACEAAGDLEDARRALEAPGDAARAPALLLRRAELAALRRGAGAAEEVDAIAAQLPPDAAAPRTYAAGISAQLRGDAAGAAESYRRALQLSPGMVQARLRLATLLTERRDLASARAELESILGEDALSRPARLALARVRLLSGDPAGAAAEASRLLALSTRDAEAGVLLVAARAKEGRLSDAARAFEEIERREPGHPVVGLVRSLVFLATLDLERAPEGVTRLVAESADARDALEGLAAAEASRRQLADSLLSLRASIPAGAQGAGARVDLARRLAAAGRPDLAERDLEGALADDPTRMDARLLLAELAAARGEWTRAAAAARAVVEAAPEDLAARALLARALLASKDAPGALALAEGSPGAPAGGAVDAAAGASLVALARAGFAAAVEAGDLERAERRLDALAPIGITRTSTERAAAALALGLDDAARARLAVGPTSTAVLPEEQDAEWIAAALETARGDPAAAAVRARRAGLDGSVTRAVILVDAHLALGERRLALDAAERAAAAAEALRAAGSGWASGQTGPIARALSSWAREATPEDAARAGRPLHRLLVAARFGHRAAVLRLSSEALAPGMPRHPLPPLVAARALEDAGELPRAQEVLEAALAAHPRSLSLLEALGRVLVDRGEYEAAARLAVRAAAAAHEEATVRALLRMEGGRRSDARRSASPRRGPAPTERTADLSWVYGRDAGAIDDALALVFAGGDDALELGLGEVVIERLGRALETIARSRDVAAVEARARLYMGLAYERVRRLEAARRELEQVVALDPAAPEAIAAARAREGVLRARSGGRRPGATFEDASPLSPGAPLEDSLGVPGAAHVYRLEVTATARVVLSCRGPADAATLLVLARREARGPRVLKSAPLPPAAEARWELALAPAAYAVELRASGGVTVAPYRLSLAASTATASPEDEGEPNDDVAGARSLPAGGRVLGSAGPLADRDLFRVEAGTAGGALDLRVASRGGGAAVARLLEVGVLGEVVRKTLVAPSGTAVLVPGLVPPAGGILVEATGPESALVEYEVSVEPRPPRDPALAPLLAEPDDHPPSALAVPPLASGAPPRRYAGTLEPAGDRDLLRLPPGEVRVGVRAPRDLDIAVDVLAPSAEGGVEAVRTVRLGRGASGTVPLTAEGARVASGAALLLAVRAAEPSGSSGEEYEIELRPAR